MRKYKLLLPTSEAKAKALASAASTPDEVFTGLPTHECAALMAIQLLAVTRQPSPISCESNLRELISVGVSLREAFQKVMIERYVQSAFKSGFEKLDDLGIGFLSDEELLTANFISGSGHWRDDFTKSELDRRNPITETIVLPNGATLYGPRSHAAIYRALVVEGDEHVHIEALAGTGKTHITCNLAVALAGVKPLVLANNPHQLAVVVERLGKGTLGMTSAEFANAALALDETAPRAMRTLNRSKQARPSDSQIAEALNLQSVAGLPPQQIATFVLNTVRRFCESAERQVGEEHLPFVPNGIKPPELAYLVELAAYVWEATRRPEISAITFPIYPYHRYKQLHLSESKAIPHAPTHIIIDESHDIPAPLHQFITRSDVAAITLGDNCQQLDARRSLVAPHVRKRDVYASVRAGRQIESAVNTIISHNPLFTAHELVGNGSISTQVHYYEKVEFPNERCLVLVQSEWGLFEYAQRLKALGARYCLLAGAEQALRFFASDAIRLYRESHRGTSPALMRFKNWDELKRSKHAKDPAFVRVERLLERGFTDSHMDQILLDQVANKDATYVLGRVMDSKSMEADSVMLTPDLICHANGTKYEVARRFATLYTGATRVRHKLYVPGVLQDWAIDQHRKAIEPKP